MRKILIVFIFSIISISTFAQNDTIKWDKYWFIQINNPNQNEYLYEYQDTLGNILIPKGKYEMLGKPDEFGFINAWKKMAFKDIENNVGFIDINDHILIPFNYSRTFKFSNNLACVSKNGKTGYINRSGKTIIPFMFDSGGDFYEDGVALVSINNKDVIIDTSGNEIIGANHPYQEIKVNFPNDHVLWIKKDDKWAFFDLKGKPLTAFIFDEIFPVSPNEYMPNEWYSENLRWFYKGLIVVKQNHRYAILNNKMDFVVPWNMFDWISPLDLEGVMIVNKNNKYGLLNCQIKLIQPVEYDTILKIKAFENEQILISFYGKKNGKYFLFDTLGNWIDQIEYDSIKLLPLNFYIVSKNGENWILDRNGKKVNEDYKFIRDDENGFIAEKNSKIGLINFNENLIIPFEYEDIISEDFGNIFVKKDGKWGVVSKDHEILLPCIYDYITYASDDEHNESHNYVVVQNDKFGKVNIKGEEIFPCIYDGITTWVEYGPKGHYVMIGDKMGLIDYNGNTIIPIQFEGINECTGTFWVEVYQNGKVGLCFKNDGSIFLPIEYDSLFVEGNWPDNGPIRIVTFKNGMINILNEMGTVIYKNLSINDLKTKYKITPFFIYTFPCSYELDTMIHNRTYKIPKCLEDEYKRSNIPLEHLFYEMKSNH
jgi:hypothetical protein